MIHGRISGAGKVLDTNGASLSSSGDSYLKKIINQQQQQHPAAEQQQISSSRSGSSGSSGSMTSVVAQRRGKQQQTSGKGVSTVLVQEEEVAGAGAGEIETTTTAPAAASMSKTQSSHLTVPSGGGGSSGNNNNNNIRVARVRRNFCGTGPFDKHWFNVDCCGIFCALFTYFLHLYGVYAVALILLPPWMSTTDTTTGIRSISWAGLFHRTAFTSIAILAIISHFKAMTTDPGAVPPDAKPIDQELDDMSSSAVEKRGLLDPPKPPRARRLCRRCKAYKPQRAHHCSICKRCIIKMDHHCPWVNNCVGIGNHKYFLLFVFYTCVSCAYSLILVVTRFTSCNTGAAGASRGRRRHHQEHHQHEKHQTCMDRPTDLITILGLLIEALLFGMFTACMMFDQTDVIKSKVTHIDRFTNTDVGGALAGVTEVFGVGKRGLDRSASFRLDWLSPFVRVCFPSSVTDEVMGFCRPCHRRTQPTSSKASSSAAEDPVSTNTTTTTTSSAPVGALKMAEIL